MTTLFSKIRLLILCLAFSLLVHFLFMFVLKMFGTYDFTAAVNQPQGVMVDLAQPSAPQPVASESPEADEADDSRDDAAAANEPPAEQAKTPSREPAAPEGPTPSPQPSKPAVPVPEEAAPAAAGVKAAHADLPDPIGKQAAAPTVPFLSSRYEKLTYSISMLGGITIGSAELESKNDHGVTTITLRVKSNAFSSVFFRVDDLVETKHIDGRFIVTKIQQQEADFKSDETFTINPRKKTVSWMDMLHGRSLKMTLPNDNVLDTLSGIYFLRNRQLQVGRTEMLQIYDSEICAEVPVEILRREEMRLPNLKKIKTLVVRPLQKTAGIFRRTGELLIWMTDDEFKVPVKIETSVVVGKITAELVSAQSKPPDEVNVPSH